MNKRARNRLIGVTVIIVVVAAAILLSVQDDGAFQKSVAEVLSDRGLIGERVKVTGLVVPGSIQPGTNPLRFSIESEDGESDGSLHVSYKGTIPNTFGDGMKVIVTGPLGEGAKMEAHDMMVVCPSKYESKSAATIPALLSQKAVRVGKYVEVTGFVGTSSADGFTLQEDEDGGRVLDVVYAGAVPAVGTEVVVGGRLDESGGFTATTVKEPEKS